MVREDRGKTKEPHVSAPKEFAEAGEVVCARCGPTSSISSQPKQAPGDWRVKGKAGSFASSRVPGSWMLLERP